MELPSASISVVVGAGQDGHPEIMLTTNATALFVVLTTKAEGRFSDNAFLLEAGQASASPRHAYMILFLSRVARQTHRYRASVWAIAIAILSVAYMCPGAPVAAACGTELWIAANRYALVLNRKCLQCDGAGLLGAAGPRHRLYSVG